MKNIDWVNAGLFLLVAICFSYILYSIIEYHRSKDEPHEGYQRTIEYVGFDGKKHQAIVLKTGTNNWVLVEKK